MWTLTAAVTAALGNLYSKNTIYEIPSVYSSLDFPRPLRHSYTEFGGLERKLVSGFTASLSPREIR